MDVQQDQIDIVGGTLGESVIAVGGLAHDAVTPFDLIDQAPQALASVRFIVHNQDIHRSLQG
jgi:hypothetical protein